MKERILRFISGSDDSEDQNSQHKYCKTKVSDHGECILAQILRPEASGSRQSRSPKHV